MAEQDERDRSAMNYAFNVRHGAVLPNHEGQRLYNEFKAGWYAHARRSTPAPSDGTRPIAEAWAREDDEDGFIDCGLSVHSIVVAASRNSDDFAGFKETADAINERARSAAPAPAPIEKIAETLAEQAIRMFFYRRDLLPSLYSSEGELRGALRYWLHTELARHFTDEKKDA